VIRPRPGCAANRLIAFDGEGAFQHAFGTGQRRQPLLRLVHLSRNLRWRGIATRYVKHTFIYLATIVLDQRSRKQADTS